jgi:hypothetical protein
MLERGGVRLRGAPVIHDTIDNETIAINQRTGRYYSLDGPAAEAWHVLAEGTTIDGLVHHLAARYDAPPGALSVAVAEFLAALRAEELIVDAPDMPANGTVPDRPAPEPAARPRFPGLTLHQYSDMEVLLLADPIHEVDESGWPTPLPPRT